MKTFIVHVRERRVRAVSVTKCIVVAEDAKMAVALVKAPSHNAAEAKAKEKANLANEFNPFLPPIKDVSVAYTEV